MHHFWQNAPARERRSRCPLEPVLGGLIDFDANFSYLLTIMMKSFVSRFLKPQFIPAFSIRHYADQPASSHYLSGGNHRQRSN